MRKNAFAARREVRSLSPMLPLVSNTRPTATGSSSIANCVMVCSTRSSKTRKFSFSSPVTGRLSGSFTETGMSTRFVSTRRVAPVGFFFGRGGLLTRVDGDLRARKRGETGEHGGAA